jgi:hypothetical protein
MWYVAIARVDKTNLIAMSKAYHEAIFMADWEE